MHFYLSIVDFFTQIKIILIKLNLDKKIEDLSDS